MKSLTSDQISEALKSIKDTNSINLAISLLSKVKILEDTGCWIIRNDWSEYTTFNKIPAHILSYKLFIGNVINLICHKCDRKGCINFDHLFQGTNSDNRKDYEYKDKLFRVGRRHLRDGKVRSWRELSDTVNLLIERGLINDIK